MILMPPCAYIKFTVMYKTRIILICEENVTKHVYHYSRELFKCYNDRYLCKLQRRKASFHTFSPRVTRKDSLFENFNIISIVVFHLVLPQLSRPQDISGEETCSYYR